MSYKGQLLPTCQNCADLYEEFEALQKKYDELTGEKFSDRCHAALKSRAEKAEARVKELEDAGRMVVIDVAEMDSTEGLNRLIHLAALCCTACPEDIVTWQEIADKLAGALEETLNKLDKCPVGTLNYAAGVLDEWREARGRKG